MNGVVVGIGAWVALSIQIAVMRRYGGSGRGLLYSLPFAAAAIVFGIFGARNLGLL